ncbi:hypothetical protein BGZ46_003492 [Entomortierella lignicola]|nr:hypothetical protein BGZ46_003492 [Entomortierella lignicola]
MNSAFMGPFSLSTFPIGIGLTAAAHAHICKQSLAKTQEQHRKCFAQQSLSKLDLVSQLLSDLNSLTEMFELVNVVLTRLPEPRARHRGRHEPRKVRSHNKDKVRSKAKERRFDAAIHNSRWKYRSQNDNDHESFCEIHQKDNNSNTEASTSYGEAIRDTGARHNDRATNYIYENSSSSNVGRYRNLRHHRQLREISWSDRAHLGYSLSAADLEQWSKTYRAVRRAQESYMKNSNQRVRKTEPFYLSLHNNFAFSLLLSSIPLLHYIISTKKTSSFFLSRLGSWFRWSPLPLFSSLYIPLMLGGCSNPKFRHIPALISEGNTSTATNTEFGSSISTSVSYTLLPLASAVFISGVHLFAVARAQWAIRNIQKENQRQARLTRRFSIMSAFLSIREQRLKWLARVIREFEDAEAEKQDMEDNEDLYEDISDGENEFDDGNTEEYFEVTGESQTTLESATTTGVPSANIERLSQNARSHMYSVIQRERESGDDWPQVRPQGRNNTSYRDDNQERSGQSHDRPPSFDRRLFLYAFGPDLENMNLSLFLNNPHERKRILRLEFEGMRDELILLREAAIQTKY